MTHQEFIFRSSYWIQFGDAMDTHTHTHTHTHNSQRSSPNPLTHTHTHTHVHTNPMQPYSHSPSHTLTQSAQSCDNSADDSVSLYLSSVLSLRHTHRHKH